MRIYTQMDAETPFALAGDVRGAHAFETALVSHRTPAPYEIDHLGHVNNVVYLAWAQEIGVAHWRAVASEKELQDWLWVGLGHDIAYQGEIRAGERAAIRTWLAPPKGAQMARHVDVRKEGATTPAARITSTWCLIDAATRKPRRVAPTVSGLFGFG